MGILTKSLWSAIAVRSTLRRWAKQATPAAASAVVFLTGLVVTPAASYAQDLLVTRSVYGGANNHNGGPLAVGNPLPINPVVNAVASGVYPNVWNNDGVDGNFGVTAPIYVDTLTTSGTRISSLNLTAATAALGQQVATSFSSKSELAINASTNGQSYTLMGYLAAPKMLDVSNSNTPGHFDPTNTDTAGGMMGYQRAVVQINSNGSVQVTPVNAYSGNNGRAAILNNADNLYYLVGNAGNGSGTAPNTIVQNTGVQITTPGGSAETTVVGQHQGTVGAAKGSQYGFSVAQTNPLTGNPYGPTDKSGKDDNFRGETIFNNTLYATKGSGSNGINTVYQVGKAGSLPTAANASSTTFSILPGLPTGLASATNAQHPFGIWFANADTLYVADEGNQSLSDTPANNTYAGLEKWILSKGTWQLAYTLQAGLNLDMPYSVPGYPSSLDPATDGLRNIIGQMNGDGTVTIYAVTSTISASGDQGADPNKLVSITDTLSATTLPGAESFTTLESAGYGEVLRGVALGASVPEPSTLVMLLIGLGSMGVFWRRRLGKAWKCSIRRELTLRRGARESNSFPNV